MSTAILPERLYTEGRVVPDHALVVDDAGRIEARVHTSSLPASTPRLALPGRLLLPGFVNAHSHAFQRAIRGRSQRPSPGDDTFWSWREAMYAVALQLDPDSVYDISRLAFLEMLRAGFTAVGEFHYLHHQPDGTPYATPNALAHAVIQAAEDVGIRITLLLVAYARAGYQRPENPRQRRFIDPSPEAFLARLDALSAHARGRDAAGSRVAVGVAPHSVRALDRAWLEAIGGYLDAHPMPVHAHASEQRAELEQCRAEHGGATPIEVLDEALDFSRRSVTLVHATHATEAEIERMARTGARVCACPVTERDLGDGFLPGQALVGAGVPIVIGSDSHAQIDPFTELRLLEYHERLRRESRNVLSTPRHHSTAHHLIEIGSRAGSESLGLPRAELEPGQPLDAVALDLGHASLLGCEGDDLLAAAVFAADPGAVRDVFVGGQRRVEDGRHPMEAEAARAYVERLRALS